MDEVNPILFYGTLYRIGELIIKTQLKAKHNHTYDHEHDTLTLSQSILLDPSYELDLLRVLIIEGYKYYLLFSLSSLRGKFNSFNVIITTIILTSIGLLSNFIEGNLTLETFLTGSALSLLNVVFTSCSAVFIQKSRGRLAGFIELCNVVLENLLLWLLRQVIKEKFKDPGTIVSIISLCLSIVWYLYLDGRLVKRIITSMDVKSFNFNDFSKFLFFISLSLFKFLEYPVSEEAYLTPFMVDDVLQDVFVTVFIFIMLFMKGNRRRQAFQSLSNTIAIVFIFVHCLCYLLNGDLYLRLLLANSQINTIRTILEFSYIRKGVLGKKEVGEEGSMDILSFIMMKAFFGTLFMVSKFMFPYSLIIISPVINVGMSFFYLNFPSERMLSYIRLPDVSVMLSFIFLVTLVR